MLAEGGRLGVITGGWLGRSTFTIRSGRFREIPGSRKRALRPMLDHEGRPVVEGGDLDDEELDPSVLSSAYQTSWTSFVDVRHDGPRCGRSRQVRDRIEQRALQVKPALDAHGFAGRRNAWRIESLQV